MGDKIFAPCALHHQDGSFDIDLDAFVMRIILFDNYVLQTNLMRDLARLTKVFGVEGLRVLLDSGAVSIHSDATTMGQFETTDSLGVKRPTGLSHEFLPYNHFDLGVISISDRKEYVSSGLKHINDLKYPVKQKQKLKSSILDHLTEVPNQLEMVNWAHESLLSNGLISKLAVRSGVQTYLKKTIDSHAIAVNFKNYGTNGYSVETNLREILGGISEYEEHKAIERGILSTTGFYQRLSLLKSYDAIGWFSKSDSEFLVSEMKIAADKVNATIQEERLGRILSIKELPTFTAEKEIDVYALLSFRESKQCKEFRAWLTTIDNLSDEEIIETTKSFRAAFGAALGSVRSRAARFMLAGVIGVMHPVPGLAIGIADQFIIDKLFPRSGPISFINDSLPRLWEN